MTDRWPFVRRTPHNPGSTPVPGPREPTLVWKHEVNACVYGTPIVDDSRVYVGTAGQPHWEDNGCLFAIDRATGERVWTTAEEALEIRGTPGIYGDRLYAGDLKDRAYSVEMSTGTSHQHTDELSLTPPDGVAPIGHDGTVFTTPYRLEARDADSWELQWALGETAGHDKLIVEEPPAIYDGTVVVATEAHTDRDIYIGQNDDLQEVVTETQPSITALDAATGTLRWKRSLPGRARSPAVVDGVVYLATQGSEPQGKRYLVVHTGVDEQPVPDDDPVEYHAFGTIHAIDIETGREYWSHRLDEKLRTAPAVYRDTVCAGTQAGTVVAVDAETGTRRWETRIADDDRVKSWPTIAADTVYVGSSNASLYALDRHDGSVRWRFDTEAAVPSNPAVVDGTVYVGDYCGTVYAIAD